jgi:hypothetical protein
MSECKKCKKTMHGSGWWEGDDGPYCSPACFDASVPVKTCGQCGREYTGKTYGYSGYCSEQCYDDAYYEPPDPQEARDRAEYEAGKAEGERYQAEKAVYGPELAEAFRAQDEHNRFWKHGED